MASEALFTSSEYRNKAVLLDVTNADPQARVHVQAGSAGRDGSAAAISEARKAQPLYARLGQVSFDERSHKLVTLAVESSTFGRLGEEGSDLIDQLGASTVGGTDGGSVVRKYVCKEHTFFRPYR